MPLPPCAGPHMVLPYRDDPYPATLNEIERHFVDLAPAASREARAYIMRAVRLHHDLVTRYATKKGITTRMFLDGGFVTWKSNAPKDADCVLFVPPQHYPQFTGNMSLWTLSKVSATLGGDDGPTIKTAELRPGFGLVDAYVNPDRGPRRRRWHDIWSSVRNPVTREIIEGARKGYIEVVNE